MKQIYIQKIIILEKPGDLSVKTGLAVIILIGVLVALFPVIVDTIDNILYQSSHAAITQTSVPEGVKIIEQEAVSQQGCDKLVVSPAKAVVPPGETIEVKINVYFKHSQPCPYNDWRVEYSVSGGIEIVDDDGGKLIDSKTYQRILEVKVNSDGVLTVTFYYGTGCPYGEKEEVQAFFTTSEEGFTNISINTSTTTTTAPEETEYFNITGKVTNKDTGFRTITVDNKVIYIRGEWLELNTNTTLEATELVEKIPVGAEVIVVCKRTESGKNMAMKIIINNKEIYVRSEG